MKGRFLSNTYNPALPDARMSHCYTYYAWCEGSRAMEEEWQHHLKWINSNLVDRPKATKWYTTEQLEARGMIGVYRDGVWNSIKDIIGMKLYKLKWWYLRNIKWKIKPLISRRPFFLFCQM